MNWGTILLRKIKPNVDIVKKFSSDFVYIYRKLLSRIHSFLFRKVILIIKNIYTNTHDEIVNYCLKKIMFKWWKKRERNKNKCFARLLCRNLAETIYKNVKWKIENKLLNEKIKIKIKNTITSIHNNYWPIWKWKEVKKK